MIKEMARRSSFVSGEGQSLLQRNHQPRSVTKCCSSNTCLEWKELDDVTECAANHVNYQNGKNLSIVLRWQTKS